MDSKPPIIRSLVLKRFRSLPAAQIEFDNPTILVGRNGSGKSNLVSAFSFLAEAMAAPLQAVFDREGGISTVRNRSSGRSYPPHLGMRVGFDRLNGESGRGFYAFEIRALKNYGFEVVREQCSVGEEASRAWFDREGSRFRSNVTGLNPALDAAALGLPVIGGEERFAPALRALAGMRVYSIEPGKVRDMQEPDSGVALKADGANVTSVLKEIERRSPDDFARISEILGTIVPNTRRMSKGGLRALAMLAAVFQRPRPSVIAIEAPEASLHPGALDSVVDVLLLAGEWMQVVVTTHSPELLDATWIADRHLRIVEWREGATRVAAVSGANRQAIQQHLMGPGELLRANALEPERHFDEQPGGSRLFADLLS